MAKSSKKGKKIAGKNEESDIFKIVKMVMERNFDPVQPHTPTPFPPPLFSQSFGHRHTYMHTSPSHFHPKGIEGIQCLLL